MNCHYNYLQHKYYYLLYIQDKIYELQNGAAQPHVYSRDIEKFKISVPSLEKQQEIVNYFDSKNVRGLNLVDLCCFDLYSCLNEIF